MILGQDIEDLPPAYEAIVQTEKCPSYEEAIIQVQNLLGQTK